MLVGYAVCLENSRGTAERGGTTTNQPDLLHFMLAQLQVLQGTAGLTGAIVDSVFGLGEQRHDTVEDALCLLRLWTPTSMSCLANIGGKFGGSD